MGLRILGNERRISAVWLNRGGTVSPTDLRELWINRTGNAEMVLGTVT